MLKYFNTIFINLLNNNSFKSSPYYKKNIYLLTDNDKYSTY